MLYPSINDLLDITGNRYILVIEVAKRAREIVEGSECLVNTEDKKPVSIATQEVYNGKITYELQHAEERDEIRDMIDMANFEASLEAAQEEALQEAL